MYWRELIAKLWWVGLLAVLMVAAIFYLVIGQGFRTRLQEQASSRELTIARAGANNIESFFQQIGKSLALLSQSPNVELFNSSTEDELDNFVSQWQDNGLIAGVILTDKGGIVKYNANVLGTHDVGASVADRDYYIWASQQKRTGVYFVGSPVTSRLGASEGETIVPLSSPVFYNKFFVGALSTPVKLKPLTERYLNLMRIGNDTHVYLLDANGKSIYNNSNVPLESDVRVALRPGLSGQFSKNGKVVAYSPVNLGNETWLLVVSSPPENLFTSTITFHVRQAFVLVLMIIITFSFGVIVSRETRNKYQNKL